MKTYEVLTTQTGTTIMEVEANSEEEAIEMVQQEELGGGNIPDDFSWSFNHEVLNIP